MTNLHAKNNLSKIDLKNIKLFLMDFDGVLTDNYVYVDQEGRESVKAYRSDGIGLSKLKLHGIKIAVISTEKNPVVSERCKKLLIDCYQAVENKGELIKSLIKDNNLKASNVLFIGNDINDISAFKEVGIPVGVHDSFNEIDEYIIYKTKKNGGMGAVREVCDLIDLAINTHE